MIQPLSDILASPELTRALAGDHDYNLVVLNDTPASIPEVRAFLLQHDIPAASLYSDPPDKHVLYDRAICDGWK